MYAKCDGYVTNCGWAQVAGGVMADFANSKLTETMAVSGLPNFDLTMMDTACVGAEGIAKSTEVLLNMAQGNTPFGVIGASCSGVTYGVANMMGLAQIPTISATATNPALSSRTAYPYFYRVCVPDGMSAAFLYLYVMHQFNWMRFVMFADLGYGKTFGLAIETVRNANPMFTNMVSYFEQDLDEDWKVTCQGDLLMGGNDVTTGRKVADCIQRSRTRVLLALGYGPDIRTVACALIEKAGADAGFIYLTYVWVGADHWKWVGSDITDRPQC